jgi:hypothetical protein
MVESCPKKVEIIEDTLSIFDSTPARLTGAKGDT